MVKWNEDKKTKKTVMCMGVDSGLSIDSLKEENIIDDVTEMEKTHGEME